jgi:predicted transcriptional regulator
MTQITIRIPDEIAERLDALCKLTKMSRTQVLQALIIEAECKAHDEPIYIKTELQDSLAIFNGKFDIYEPWKTRK